MLADTLPAWSVSPSAQVLPQSASEAPYLRGTSGGLALGLARTSSDFRVAASPRELVRDSIVQILGIRADDGRSYGELPWRPEFGSLLHRLLYMNLDEGFAALVRARVVGAISTWEPRCRVRDVVIERIDEQGGTHGVITVHYDVVQAGTGQLVVAAEKVTVHL